MPLVALCLVAIIGIAAIAIDGGILVDYRRQVQMASDAAALAGAIDLFNHYPKNKGQDPDGTARTSALHTAAANGFTDGGNSTVTVNIPPTSGPFAGDTSGYVEVIIRYNQRRYFSAIWAREDLVVAARAVARGQWKPLMIGILLLDPSSRGALTAGGSANVEVKNQKSIIINSNNAAAAELSGSADVTATEIDTTGVPGTSTGGASKFHGTIKSGVAPTPDPIASVRAPDPPLPVFTALDYSRQAVLSPGTYVGGISLGSNSSVTLQPGIYYLQGGGLSLGGHSSIRGDGVMIYNDTGKISLGGNSSVTLTPPTSGPYQGITIFQGRDNSQQLDISGSGSLDITGTLYAPKAPFNLTGSGKLNNVGSQIIGYSLTVWGSADFIVSPGDDGKKKRFIQLVE